MELIKVPKRHLAMILPYLKVIWWQKPLSVDVYLGITSRKADIKSAIVNFELNPHNKDGENHFQIKEANVGALF